VAQRRTAQRSEARDYLRAGEGRKAEGSSGSRLHWISSIGLLPPTQIILRGELECNLSRTAFRASSVEVLQWVLGACECVSVSGVAEARACCTTHDLNLRSIFHLHARACPKHVGR